VARLIVNADDFGLTGGVNRAIAELHSAGVLTSTSLMACAGATDEAIGIARSTPTLGVGCHVVLVDGEPMLPPGQIPSLVDPRTGSLHPTLTAFLPRLFAGRIRLAEIEAETRAQIEYLQNKGLHLTHIDTHKHTHMFPAVLRTVLRAARACGIRAVRNPFEPSWALRTAIGAPWLRLAQVSALRWLEPVCRRIIAEERFSTTDGTIAVAGTGSLDTATLRCLLKQMPAGTWELVTHPGYNDADLTRVRTRLRASRDVERQALAALKEFPIISLVTFSDLRSALISEPAKRRLTR
jgi:hopanoid biosynthesis associated protein HpnK